jgi:hypothetical protein
MLTGRCCGAVRGHFSASSNRPHKRKTALNWSPLTESNRRPSPYHGDALPTELRGPVFSCLTCCFAAQVRYLGRALRPLPDPWTSRAARWRVGELTAPSSRGTPVPGTGTGTARPKADSWRDARVSPASHPGARPPAGGWISVMLWPVRASSQDTREFEFHMSPLPSSSRPQVSGGMLRRIFRAAAASAGSSLTRCGLCTASLTSGMCPSRQHRIS